jgi:bifunctional enzyme CysN/CysC
VGAEDRSSTDGTELSDAPAAEAPTGDAPAAEGAPARTSILERRMAASDLMRLATAGSVDDGKSTLIGRLLFDSKTLFIDQLAAVERVSKERGHDYTDLALLTDGLRAEREQGITIDVAYRYFATPRRRFIIADTPGHIQYTRNMVTGASTADVAVLLLDARRGITEQSRRHAFIASLLGVPHVLLCVNKMDLVDWSEDSFETIRAEFVEFATRLRVRDLSFIPISALKGDNVVSQSTNMPWYDGLPLLRHLERLYVASDRNLVDVRFPVQYVIRPQSNTVIDYRGYAGTVASGVMKPGDPVTVLPSGLETKIESIETADGPVDEAFPPMAVTITLADHLDISRGDMLVRPHNVPTVAQEIDAQVCWMDESAPLTKGGKYAIKHTTRWARAVVRDIAYRIDINSLHRVEGVDSLALNEIGRVQLRVTQPLFVDTYQDNRQTGSFILVDERSNKTVGAGVIGRATVAA